MANIYTSLKNFSVQTSNGENEALLMPKLKFRFRVEFSGLGNKDDTDILQMTRQIVDVKRPSVKFDEQKIEVYNSRINYIGKPTWNDITVTVRDDVSSMTTGVIARQIQKQFDFYEQSIATSAGDYKFDMSIEMTDGNNGSQKASIIEKWVCYGCMITQADYDSLDYKTSEAVQIKLTIKMDNCVQYIGTTENPIGDTLDGFNGVGSGAEGSNTRVPSAASSWNMVYSGRTIG